MLKKSAVISGVPVGAELPRVRTVALEMLRVNKNDSSAIGGKEVRLADTQMINPVPLFTIREASGSSDSTAIHSELARQALRTGIFVLHL